MSVSASVRLTGHLNALRHGRIGADVAARTVVDDHAAHHVIDPDGLLGLDPLRANDLAPAMSAAVTLVDADWVICLPRPGWPAGLRGPALATAIDAGSAVAPSTGGGVALVPLEVGRAVQWSVVAADRSGPLPDGYGAERTLSELVLSAARELAALDVASGATAGRRRPDAVDLGPGYRPRQRVAADRALRLLDACEHALAADSTAISSFEETARRAVLGRLRDAAADALTAALVWPGDRDPAVGR